MSQANYEAVATSIFCDDVRREVGNKSSYMGVYQTQLKIPESPWFIPKLCCVVNVRMPVTQLVSVLECRLLKDVEVLGERTVNLSDMRPQHDAPNAEVRHLTMVLQLIDIRVESGCVFKSRVYLDGEELKAGALRVALNTSTTAKVLRSVTRV